jgi:hypothetical protein
MAGLSTRTGKKKVEKQIEWGGDPVWGRGGCQVEEQRRGPGGRQWLDAVGEDAGQAAQRVCSMEQGRAHVGRSGERKTGRA